MRRDAWLWCALSAALGAGCDAAGDDRAAALPSGGAPGAAAGAGVPAAPASDDPCGGAADHCALADPVGGMSRVPPHLDFADDLRPWLASQRMALTVDEALVAVPDAETQRVVFFDAERLDEVAAVDVGRLPEHLLTLPDGDIAVACRGDDGVALVDPEAGVVRRWIATADEPRGMALAPDGERLYVAAFGAGVVEAFRVADGAPLWRSEVDAGPIAVAVDARGERVWVSHLAGERVSELMPASGEVVRKRKLLEPLGEETASMALALLPLPGGEVLAPFTIARTGSRDPQRIVQTDTYGGGGGVAFEVDTTPLLTSALTRLSVGGAITTGIQRPGYRVVGGTVLDSPVGIVAAARHPNGEVVLVDQTASQLAVVRPELMDTQPALHAAVVLADAAPGAALFTRDGARLFVVSWLERSVGMLDTRDFRNDTLRQAGWRRASYARAHIADEVALGRRLFHTLDARVSTLGVTCASCHPDGREDGRTWIQGFGPRQTPRLAGRLEDTAPFNWLGSEPTLEANLHKTIARLAGLGLDEEASAALVAYLRSDLDGLRKTPREAAALDAQAARGKALFDSPEVGCASCHDPSDGFSDGLEHDIGTTSDLERELFAKQRALRLPKHFDRVPKRNVAFDTPSLADVGATAPYFHDGSAKTLREVLVERNVGDRMGVTSHLLPDDIDALVAYLETL